MHSEAGIVGDRKTKILDMNVIALIFGGELCTASHGKLINDDTAGSSKAGVVGDR